MRRDNAPSFPLDRSAKGEESKPIEWRDWVEQKETEIRADQSLRREAEELALYELQYGGRQATPREQWEKAKKEIYEALVEQRLAEEKFLRCLLEEQGPHFYAAYEAGVRAGYEAYWNGFRENAAQFMKLTERIEKRFQELEAVNQQIQEIRGRAVRAGDPLARNLARALVWRLDGRFGISIEKPSTSESGLLGGWSKMSQTFGHWPSFRTIFSPRILSTHWAMPGFTISWLVGCLIERKIMSP